MFEKIVYIAEISEWYFLLIVILGGLILQTTQQLLEIFIEGVIKIIEIFKNDSI